MRKVIVFALAAVIALVVAVPAFATGADGAGRDFGLHHAEHAVMEGGFTRTDNPGVMHKGFSGWMGE